MRAFFGVSLLTRLMLLGTSVGTGRPVGAASPRSHAIADVTIIDVERGVSIPGQTVLIQDDRIRRIGPAAAARVPAGAASTSSASRRTSPGCWANRSS